MHDYPATAAQFSWDGARALLTGASGGGLNIASAAVDRHLAAGRGNKLALRFLARDGGSRNFTYAELACASNRFANCLRSFGLGKGAVVFSLLGRDPAQYFASLGALKNGSVFSPLFSAFGPEPIRARMTIGEARALVTTEAQYRRKVEPWRKDLPSLTCVFITDLSGEAPEGTVDLAKAMESASDDFQNAATNAEDMALLHFTSGTTGKPKGVVHVHEAVASHHVTGQIALDLHPDDVFWCTADPGWVTGMSYGILSPLTNGVTTIVDEAEFDAERWYRILEEQGVSVWYTAPTAIRMLMKLGTDLPKRFDLSHLRFMASVGEPLNPEAVVWGQEALGRPFHDNWWQTETGGIMIANYQCMDIKPGSMGKPLPGITAGIVERTADGGVNELVAPGSMGELALKRGWPSMMRAYLGDDERYRRCFVGDWYLTGDLATRDEEGYFWFVGRADDVIKSAGHLIGPFEVESALMEHPAVAEAGVIGVPDETAGQLVKAFVALKQGFEGTASLRKELLGHARKRLGPAVAPKDIAFRDNLPKTRSGKVMRRLLRARELGLPEGDISTLESDEQRR
jgi:acetyl-CoA synthetase